MKYLMLLILIGCSVQIRIGQKPVETVPEIIEEVEPTQEPSKYEKGKTVFRQRCMSCHANPKVGGSLCPPNYGSSLELLRLKVLEGKYPDGYKPKKPTKVMPRFPYLKDDIENLFEYLNN